MKKLRGILKAQLKREEYQVNQLNDEYNNTIKIYKGYQDQILATKGIIDHNLTVLLEDASNHAIQIHQRLKNTEEAYDNMMKELIIIQKNLTLLRIIRRKNNGHY